MNANTDPRLNAWSARIEDMPRDRHHQLEHLIRFAILAPSTHNSQPWRFRVRKDGIEVHADHRCCLPPTMPDSKPSCSPAGAMTGTMMSALPL
jgi:hypothetical protein